MELKAKERKTTLRTILISGLLILIPVVVTIYILIFMFNLLDGWLAPMGGQILRAVGFDLPVELKRIPGFGIVATFLLVFFTGIIASHYLGRRLIQFGEKLIKNIPVVSSIYSALRQVVDSFSITGSKTLKTVVLFQFPAPGTWAIGFLTTDSLQIVKKAAKQDLVNVFYPTSPNPTSGFLVMVPRDKIHVLPLTPEEAIKLIASVGLLQKEPVSINLSQNPSEKKKKAMPSQAVRTKIRKAK